MIVRFVPPRALILGLALVWSPVPNHGLRGQSGTVVTEENFRAQRNGALLGQVLPGTRLDVLEVMDDWLRIDLRGWVWTRSLQTVRRSGFDLVVAAPSGENLRGTPSGEIVGHLEEGTLLEEVERVEGWVRVHRAVWIWRESVELDSAPDAVLEAGSEQNLADRWARSGARGSPILNSPDGDTLARTVAGVDLRVLAREGSWARVRLEGWAWLPEVAEQEEGMSVLTDVSLQDVQQAPEEYRGRLLQWDLQFISLERAEKVRTDFYEGEPFLLTRTGGGESTFVYVAIPPERLSEARGLSPLEWIRVVGRVRTGAATLTGSPILDLLELQRIRR